MTCVRNDEGMSEPGDTAAALVPPPPPALGTTSAGPKALRLLGVEAELSGTVPHTSSSSDVAIGPLVWGEFGPTSAWSYEGTIPQTVTLTGDIFSQFSKYLGTYRIVMSGEAGGSTNTTSNTSNTRADGAPYYAKRSRCLLWPFEPCGSEEQVCQVCRRRTEVFLYRDSYGVWAVTDVKADISQNKAVVCSSRPGGLPSEPGLEWMRWGETRPCSGGRHWLDASSVVCGEGDEAAAEWDASEARLRRDMEPERVHVPLRVNLSGHCQKPSISALMGTVS